METAVETDHCFIIHVSMELELAPNGSLSVLLVLLVLLLVLLVLSAVCCSLSVTGPPGAPGRPGEPGTLKKCKKCEEKLRTSKHLQALLLAVSKLQAQ